GRALVGLVAADQLDGDDADAERLLPFVAELDVARHRAIAGSPDLEVIAARVERGGLVELACRQLDPVERDEQPLRQRRLHSHLDLRQARRQRRRARAGAIFELAVAARARELGGALERVTRGAQAPEALIGVAQQHARAAARQLLVARREQRRRLGVLPERPLLLAALEQVARDLRLGL